MNTVAMGDIQHRPDYFSGRVGPHSYQFEPPDIFHIRYVGPVELEHFLEFNVAISRLALDRKIYVLRDAREGGFVTNETRAYAAKQADISYVAAVVTYGSSFQNQTVIDMMVKAANSLKREAFPVGALATEAEARAWIEEHRRMQQETTTG